MYRTLLKLIMVLTYFLQPQLVNREKNSKKKVGTPLSQDMLNELDKNHMGGLENYPVNESMYDMEWIDDRDLPRKVMIATNTKLLFDNHFYFLGIDERTEWF